MTWSARLVGSNGMNGRLCVRNVHRLQVKLVQQKLDTEARCKRCNKTWCLDAGWCTCWVVQVAFVCRVSKIGHATRAYDNLNSTSWIFKPTYVWGSTLHWEKYGGGSKHVKTYLYHGDERPLKWNITGSTSLRGAAPPISCHITIISL